MVSVFVSNGGISWMTAIQAVAMLHRYGIDKVELSCGKTDKNDLNDLKNFVANGMEIRLHNYFPNYEEPFVMNLGSRNKDTRRQSRKLIERALSWSSELGSDFYAFHAGFRYDLHTSELGGNTSSHVLRPLKETQQIFFDEFFELQSLASNLGIVLAVENNVYDEKNYQVHADNNPFLFCGDEASAFNEKLEIPILLDFAHLNVSAHTLNFSRVDALKKISHNIVGYHFSDNNGFADTNNHVTENSWFLQYIDPNIKYLTLEVYTSDIKKLHHDIEILEKRFER